MIALFPIVLFPAKTISIYIQTTFFVTDGRSQSQPACPREWKKHEEENE
jgi:hypothetical protein